MWTNLCASERAREKKKSTCSTSIDMVNSFSLYEAPVGSHLRFGSRLQRMAGLVGFCVWVDGEAYSMEVATSFLLQFFRISGRTSL